MYSLYSCIMKAAKLNAHIVTLCMKNAFYVFVNFICHTDQLKTTKKKINIHILYWFEFREKTD